MKISPINFLWRKVEVIVDEQTGEVVRAMAMVPAPRYANAAAKQFAEGEEYTLDQIEERSMASHKQYFAALNSGYKNLPDNVGFRKKNDGSFELDLEGNRIPTWPSVKHYRKWLLIETGGTSKKKSPRQTRLMPSASPSGSGTILARKPNIGGSAGTIMSSSSASPNRKPKWQ